MSVILADVMQFADMVDHYDLPARDRDQRRPEVVCPPRWRAAAQQLRGKIRRRRRGRRLAYLDNTFPWSRSGFRYHEALAIHALLPDTLFFSTWDLDDPFPAPVHSIADFPSIAVSGGVTDVYGVFQLFLEGLLGMPPADEAEFEHAFRAPDLSQVLRNARMRVHGSIYPGGGFVPTPHGIARATELVARMQTALSYVPEVIEGVPGITPVDQAFTETSFYAQTTRRWDRTAPLVCLFAADAPPRKGLDITFDVFREFDPAAFHLHVVGPHGRRRHELSEEVATFHGWLSPTQLRDLHRDVHVFLSPVRAEEPGPLGSHQGVTDGFPTQAAADAVSGGCLLVSSNPSGDHRVLLPEVHYLEREPDAAVLRATLSEVASDLARARAIAEAGSARLRARMDVRAGTAQKLRHMGFDVPLPTEA